MQVTYLGHSGFRVEWADTVCVFDWTEGELPPPEASQRLIVFVSHHHWDHYKPDIFRLSEKYPDTVYIISRDVENYLPRVTPEKLHLIGAGRKRVLSGGGWGALTVQTLCSTDEGVAFVVNYGGHTVYHAGDLHWWAWPDDTMDEARSMKSRFFAEIARLRGVPLDAAFLPLDPRLGNHFYWGLDAFMETATVRYAFPMHMWGEYETVDRLLALPESEPYRDRIVRLRQPGDVFEI